MSKMTLDNLIVGKQQKPFRIALYGVEGVGKSTAAAAAPNPIFINSEDGTAHLDVARFPQPATFAEIQEAITTLFNEKHDFKTLVLDSADWAEQLIRAHVCREHGKNGIEEIPYGKGWSFAQDNFMKLLQGFDALYAKGMNVIIIAHAQIKAHNDPMLESSYDRYIMKLHKHNEALLKEWCDALLFANFDTTLIKDDKQGGKTKGKSFGKRLLYGTRTAAYDAKNRYNLPDKLPLDWPTLNQYLQPQPATTGA